MANAPSKDSGSRIVLIIGAVALLVAVLFLLGKLAGFFGGQGGGEPASMTEEAVQERLQPIGSVATAPTAAEPAATTDAPAADAATADAAPAEAEPATVAEAPAAAAGGAAAGKARYDGVCTACHGAQAQGMGIFPKLAGRPADELAALLKRYRAGEQVGPNTAMMAPNAKGLSDSDIADLTAYISSL